MAQPVASSTARQKNFDGTMSLRLLIAAVVLCAVAAVPSEETSAQEIDFGKVDKFESLASGTLQVGAPPKTIVDDSERHVVILTTTASLLLLPLPTDRRRSFSSSREVVAAVHPCCLRRRGGNTTHLA